MTGPSPDRAEAESPATENAKRASRSQRAPVAAVDAGVFADAMAPFAIPTKAALAVAVSGGSDSMALLLLLRAWCASREIVLTAVTVDHQLRDASSLEASQVAAWCAALGVTHVVLPWEKGHAQRGLSRSPQAAARTARYDLLLRWCRTNRHAYLCVAHHADDQIETFFLRLARGSGVDGLAAMAPHTRRGGIHILRPLLSFPKDALKATCRAAGQEWIEDPSNGNRQSARVRFRQARALLAAEGLDDARLLATVGHLQRARRALEGAVDNLLAQTCRWDQWGACHMDVRAFVEAPAEIALRALARTLIMASGADYGPRFENLERLYLALSKGPWRYATGPWRDTTLHGCHIMRDGMEMLICREAVAVAGETSVEPGETILWDGRFRISVPNDAPGFVVARLTAAAWKEAGAAGQALVLHPAIRGSLPMLTDAAGLAAIPLCGYLRADLQLRVKEPIFCGFAPLVAENDG